MFIVFATSALSQTAFKEIGMQQNMTIMHNILCSIDILVDAW